MSNSSSPFDSAHSKAPDPGPRDAIAQSVEARESSRVQRLQRMLQAVLDTTRVNPPASPSALDQLLGSVLDAVMIASEAHMGNLQLVEPVSQALRIRVHRCFSNEFVSFFNSVAHGTLACGTAFAQSGPVVVEDVDASPLFTGDARHQIAAAGIKAVQSVALVHEGRKLAVISVHYRSTGIPLRSQEAFASTARIMAEIVAAGVTGSATGRRP